MKNLRLPLLCLLACLPACAPFAPPAPPSGVTAAPPPSAGTDLPPPPLPALDASLVLPAADNQPERRLEHRLDGRLSLLAGPDQPPVWTAAVEFLLAGDLVVVGDVVACPAWTGVLAFDLNTGSLLWTEEQTPSLFDHPLPAAGPTGLWLEKNGRPRLLEARSGLVLWEQGPLLQPRPAPKPVKKGKKWVTPPQPKAHPLADLPRPFYERLNPLVDLLLKDGDEALPPAGTDSSGAIALDEAAVNAADGLWILAPGKMGTWLTFTAAKDRKLNWSSPTAADLPVKLTWLDDRGAELGSNSNYGHFEEVLATDSKAGETLWLKVEFVNPDRVGERILLQVRPAASAGRN